MIDTHAHLQFPELLGKIEEIISESKKAGVTGVIIASSNVSGSKKAVELADKYPNFLYASVGIHPQKTDPENKTSIKDQLLELESLLSADYGLQQKTIVAIGETGLDFSSPPPGEENRSIGEQEALFKGQIDLAIKYNLPLIIHARQAIDEVIEILSYHLKPSTQHLKGVFHCYSGGKKRVSKILELPGEWYFGFDGNLTYDQGLQATIPLIPQERIVVETDSPYLSPEPYRSQINTPATIPLIVRKISEIVSKDISREIFNNSKKLFNLQNVL
ncbi:TatD family hydrolase [Patescibacteria group bacterium]|nr:TatD family hydrolase [Patescibacteria group bacterium]